VSTFRGEAHKSALDLQVKRINCKASVVPTNGAVIRSVRFEVWKQGAAQSADAGAGTKIFGTNNWSMGNSIPLAAGSYTVRTIVTIRAPAAPQGTLLPTVTSPAFVIP